jgi:hypothetical protein
MKSKFRFLVLLCLALIPVTTQAQQSCVQDDKNLKTFFRFDVGTGHWDLVFDGAIYRSGVGFPATIQTPGGSDAMIDAFFGDNEYFAFVSNAHRHGFLRVYGQARLTAEINDSLTLDDDCRLASEFPAPVAGTICFNPGGDSVPLQFSQLVLNPATGVWVFSMLVNGQSARIEGFYTTAAPGPFNVPGPDLNGVPTARYQNRDANAYSVFWNGVARDDITATFVAQVYSDNQARAEIKVLLPPTSGWPLVSILKFEISDGDFAAGRCL